MSDTLTTTPNRLSGPCCEKLQPLISTHEARVQGFSFVPLSKFNLCLLEKEVKEKRSGCKCSLECTIVQFSPVWWFSFLHHCARSAVIDAETRKRKTPAQQQKRWLTRKEGKIVQSLPDMCGKSRRMMEAGNHRRTTALF